MLKNKLLLLLLLLAKSTSLEAQTVGVGYYAIQNKTFPCEQAMEVFNGVKRPALMFLWSTFGTSTSCVEKFIKMNNRDKQVYIHFSNECCRRNRTCGEGEFMKNTSVADLNKKLEKKDKKTLKEYEKRMDEILLFIDKMKDYNVKWFISTGLEDNYTNKAAKNVLSALKTYKKKSKIEKKITIYVNPLKSNCIANRCEIHVKNLGRDNHWLFIPDGYCVKPFDACNTNVFTQKEQESKLNAQIKNKNRYFIWWQEQQGRKNELPNQALPPRKRKITITQAQIKEANRLLKMGN